MALLTIVKISRKPKETKYGLKTSVGLLTKEYQERWLSGFEDDNNKSWQAGMTVEATVEQNGDWLNFKATKPSVDPNTINTPKIAPQGKFSDKTLSGGQPDEAYWAKKSFGMCKHAFLVEAFKVRPITYDKLYADKIEIEAEQWAEKSMRILGEPKIKTYDSSGQVDQDPFAELGFDPSDIK